MNLMARNLYSIMSAKLNHKYSVCTYTLNICKYINKKPRSFLGNDNISNILSFLYTFVEIMNIKMEVDKRQSVHIFFSKLE